MKFWKGLSALHSAAVLTGVAFAMASSQAAIPPRPGGKAPSTLNERLVRVRKDVVELEQGLIASLRKNKQAKENLAKIQELIRLQKEEGVLGRSRVRELGETVKDLESRRGVIRERVKIERDAIRQALRGLHAAEGELPQSRDALERERTEQPRRHLIGRIVQQGVREIDALRADLEDADRLESRISAEKAELDATAHELAESEEILELNRQLQIDLIEKNRDDRVAQLERWRKVKNAEAQVSDLIGQFNARMELQETTRAERAANRAMAVMADSAFAKSKGRLPYPVPGSVVGRFGKIFDKEAGLHVFKKGIQIASAAGADIRAISPGKIVYAGEMANYGRLAIIDHGDHFYSICGQLGSLQKKVGETVAMGEKIGAADTAGSPVYFEIRSRNIPVDPLQWIAATL